MVRSRRSFDLQGSLLVWLFRSIRAEGVVERPTPLSHRFRPKVLSSLFNSLHSRKERAGTSFGARFECARGQNVPSQDLKVTFFGLLSGSASFPFREIAQEYSTRSVMPRGTAVFGDEMAFSVRKNRCRRCREGARALLYGQPPEKI